MLKPKPSWMALLLLTHPAAAEVIPAPLFQDGGVLQREKPIPVWGRATPGKTVTVTFAGKSQSAKADATGKWQVNLPAFEASAEGRTLTLTEEGAPAKEIKNVVVGEVWLASGQSNMEWTINQVRKEDQQEAASRDVPLMRFFTVPKALSNTRKETVDAKWTATTPETSKNFSAVGYFFGRKLTEELKIPIGIIHSSWGGSRIEPWWAEEGLAGIPDLEATRSYRLARSPGFPEYDKPYRSYIEKIKDWADQAGKAIDAGGQAPDMPGTPPLLKPGHGEETGTYQAMIHPLVPYSVRGFLWYQGESNNGEGMLYTDKMKALIQGWRKQFQSDDAPFYYVQLAPYNYGDNRKIDLPGIWWAQQKVLEIPHTGMAVTNDIGNVGDIHPGNKSEVGRRLALWALADTYGQKDIVKSGPLFSEYKVTGSSIAVRFDHTGSGLTTRDGKAPTLFEIAGVDEVFHPADVTITEGGKSLVLSSSSVPKPDRVRFAWSQVAEPNLMNKEGLPAAAFNTHWPFDPTMGTKVSAGKPIQSSNPNRFGWDGGLTDGKWGNTAQSCYATDNSPTFPKTVTVDLGSAQTLHAIAYGTPDVGATKTVAVSISEDGKNFTEVGKNEFPGKKATVAKARFEPTKARYVRATFVDQHPSQDQYGVDFAFLSELEAYAP